MFLKKFLSVLLSLSLLVLVTNHPIQPSVAKTLTPTLTLQTAQKALATQSSFFTENKGQWDKSILFVGNTSFGKIAFTKEAIYYQMIKVEDTVDGVGANSQKADLDRMMDPRKMMDNIQDRQVSSQTIKLSFVNSNSSPQIQGENLLPNYNNYFIGNDQTKWAFYCRNYSKVTYENIWTGIDLTYFFAPEGMKYEYYVAPEADIKNLQIKVEGADITNNQTSPDFDSCLV